MIQQALSLPPAFSWRFSTDRPPRGFTIVECVAALAMLAMAMVLVAQIGVWCLEEQTRGAARQAAQELAANFLESARACPWEELGPEWAAKQKLPEVFDRQGWKLTVQVNRDVSRPRTKKVSAKVDWSPDQGPPTRAEELVGWFCARSMPAEGSKP